jgi:hypothetical protein
MGVVRCPEAGRCPRGQWSGRDGVDANAFGSGGIERGKRNPSLMVMARIADALGVHLTKLINE